MKKLGVYATTAVGATAVAMAFFGTAVAAADDYSGKTYADASKAISDAGKKAVVASRAGDTLSDDQCIVSHSQSARWIKGIATRPWRAPRIQETRRAAPRAGPPSPQRSNRTSPARLVVNFPPAKACRHQCPVG